MAGLIFEWDEDKAQHNLEKHGIAFAGALAVFEDPRRIACLDLRWNYFFHEFQRKRCRS